MKKRFEEFGEGYIDYPGKGIITDVAVANYLRKHIRFIDRFNLEKVTAFALFSQNILMGIIDEPEGNWKFKYIKKKK